MENGCRIVCVSFMLALSPKQDQSSRRTKLVRRDRAFVLAQLVAEREEARPQPGARFIQKLVQSARTLLLTLDQRSVEAAR